LDVLVEERLKNVLYRNGGIVANDKQVFFFRKLYPDCPTERGEALSNSSD
jgi:hypothetical protein